jgi:hypothetical protein
MTAAIPTLDTLGDADQPAAADIRERFIDFIS